MSEQAAAPAEGEGTPERTGPKGVVLIGALVGSLLIGGAAGVFAVGPMLAKKSGYAVAPSAHAAASDDSTDDSADGEEHDAPADGKGEAAAGGGNLHLIDNLVLNPAGSGGARFLMLATAIEFSEAARVDETKARDSEVRDVILRVLGAKSVDELSEMSYRESIKAELADSLGALYKKSKKKAIRRIYFPQFVIQ